jgi:hypothetical protein
MKKWKIAILSILLLGFVACAAYIAHIMKLIEEDWIVPGNPVDYHSKEELSELYWQNKDLLNTVKDSVLSSKLFLQALNDYGEGDFDISYQGDKIYFTDEEWADIVTVFENLHPYMIMMERKGRPLIFYIVCGTQKQDSLSKETYLYWFPNEEERAYHEEPGVFPDGVFTQIDGGWYIVEATRTR